MEVTAALAAQLTAEFGRGYGVRNLFHMVRFAAAFPDRAIVQALTAQLRWTHFTHLSHLGDPLKRLFYAEMCRVEGWSTRALADKIQRRLYERTTLSKKTKGLIAQELAALRESDQLTPDLVFKDSYLLDFLGLHDTYSEKDLEAAILREIERFLLELGPQFAFLARQKRIVIGRQDFYLDLLFYHHRLHRLVLIELKRGTFQPADFGQVELYLRWLNRHERRPGEAPPLALILCAGKSPEQLELLELEKRGIRVAEYRTKPQPKHERE